MRSLGFAALAMGFALVPLTDASAGDSAPDQQRWGNVPHARLKTPGRHMGPRWGHRVKGRWHAGHRAPGGWGGYHFATRGYQLPTYWIAPRYYIAYQTYGLPAPQAGYTWSRYYDDAVLIDRDGRVIDSRRDIQWDRYEGGYDDSDYDDDRGPPPEYGADYRYDEVTGGAEGTWEGTWKGQYGDGRPYEYSGSFDGEYRPAGAPYPAPYDDGPPPHGPGAYYPGPGPDHAPGHNPAILHHGSQVIINGMAYPAGGTVANGFYYPPPTTTTITVHSGCCTEAKPAVTWSPKPKRHWKPKPKSKIIHYK
jgi:Ni/Co efflux regulator RcnB